MAQAGLLTCWAALLLVGCGELRQGDDSEATETYTAMVAPLLKARCVSCHGSASPAGKYDLSTYRGLLGPGSDTARNVAPGDKTSRLLTKLDAIKEVKHWGYLLPKAAELAEGETAEERRAADLKALTSWVVDAGLAYGAHAVHPAGWVYPGKRSSTAFHGGALRAKSWDTTSCQSCHGEKLTGDRKKGGGSCATCHKSGPTTGCTTCHGDSDTGSSAPPMDLSWNLTSASRGVGAHAAHLKGTGPYAPVKCADCHTVPASTNAAGHLLDADKTSDLTAEVTFGGSATLGKVKVAYDTANGGCTVYCHGAGLSLPGTERKPTWTSTKKMTCQSCHPAPHSNPAYGGEDCSACHQQVFKQCPTGDTFCLTVSSSTKLAVASAALHMDGKVSLGKASGGSACYGCHGTLATKGAPAPDLKGKTATTLVSVGMHAAHLQGTSGYAGKVACSDCHKVPATLKAPGHIDNDQPAEVVFSALAQGKGKPVWDRSKATCTNVYCHNLDGGKVKSWTWTKAASPAMSCQSCHGLPPAKTMDGNTHPANTACKTCHSSAYNNSTGALDPTKHLNGKVDF